MNTEDIIKASHMIHQLQSLLSADLAITVESFRTVKIEVSTNTGANPTIYLPGSEIEGFISELIAERLDKLQAMGVDTEPVLKPYREAAEKLANSKAQQS